MTSGKNLMEQSKRTKILVAPLDWGLGHATRCIPIINELLNQGCSVIIAAENPIATLLQNEFPQIEIVNLKGYHIQYSTNKNWFALKLLSQFPKILSSIISEKRWLSNFIKTHEIDVVISDNRFGLSNKTIHCIYITHQLHIETGNSFTNFIAQKIHYYNINKFKTCWIPDFKSTPNLSGKLAHPKKQPAIPIKYLGSVSRFKNLELPIKYDVLIVLSGPEPQRTIFENLLIPQLQNLDNQICLVRGLPNHKNTIQNLPENIEVRNHLNASLLNQYICSSKIVIARSGYSTIMDLVALQKPAILIPTPGQTEQEYLGKYLMENKIFISTEQDNFDLSTSLKDADSFTFAKIDFPENNLRTIVSDLIERFSIKVEKL